MYNNPFSAARGGAPGPMNNPQRMIQEFHKFRSSFQGDPKAEVQKLLQSGKLSQDQLNQLQGMAQNFRQYLG